MKLIGVTVLTSLDDSDLAATGQRGTPGEQAQRLALLARDSGLDGVVCSPHEVAALRAACGTGFLLVVPGIRPSGAAVADQKRVMTPARRARRRRGLSRDRPAHHRGAPIPAAAARAIAAELR